jgi:dTDP-4-amino-4,6-dideoxygalactose transaminase
LSSIDWLQLPQVRDGYSHAWQAYVTYVDPDKAPRPRNEMMDILQQQGVATRPGTHAVHMLGYYRDRYNLKPEDFPGARDCDANTMALPLHNRMSSDDYQHIVSVLKAL